MLRLRKWLANSGALRLIDKMNLYSELPPAIRELAELLETKQRPEASLTRVLAVRFYFCHIILNCSTVAGPWPA